MRVKTHMLIAREAYGRIQSYLPIEFNQFAVSLGATAPDVAPHRRVKSHNPSRAAKEWREFLGFVEKRKYTTTLLSYAAGVMSHYISDTFCYAHNFYSIDLGNHLEYEVHMQRTLESYRGLEVELGEIFKNWQLLQSKGVENYIAMKNKEYKEVVTQIEKDADKMLYDIKNSIVQSAVWMLEIAYVLAPGLVDEGVAEFA